MQGLKMDSENNESEANDVLLKDTNAVEVVKGKTFTSENSERKIGRENLKMQIAAATFGAIIQLSFGFIFGFTGATLPALTDEKSNDIVLTISQVSWFNSGVSLGAVGGGLLCSFLIPFFGQKMCLLIVLPFGVISAITLGTSSTFWILLVSRIIQGGVVMMSSACATTYVAEVSHMSVRGRLIASMDVSRQIGFLLIFIMGSTSMSWRTIALVSGVSTTVLPFIGFIFLHNSPRWLASRGRISEAAKSLQFFRGKNYDCSLELNEITKQISKMNKGKKNNFAMFLNKSIFTRMLILTVLMICINYSGNLTIIAYAVSIFQSAHVPINPYMSVIIIGLLRVVGTSIFLLLVDKIGRKPLLTVPPIIAGFCMIFFGTFFYLETIWDDTSSISWLPLVSLLLFSMFTCISNPVIFLCISEILPTQFRGAGTGFLFAAFTSSSFIVTLTFPGMVDAIGSHWTFWIFAANCFLLGIIPALFIPETRNKSLEQTAELENEKELMEI